jgi:peroxiredoxin Q/BCP
MLALARRLFGMSRAMAKLTEGRAAPNFALQDENGKTVKLSDFAGKKLVLFFYPRADTPGCTRESCDFRDEIDLFKKAKTAVVGVSRDLPAAQLKFKKKYQLPFPLLSDPDHKIHEAYGAWGEKNLYGKLTIGTIRTTVLIGPDGKVVKVFSKVRVDGHAEKVLEALRAPVEG